MDRQEFVAGQKQFHGWRAADLWEEVAAMDLRGAGGERLGETSPGERGAPNRVGAGEMPVPEKSIDRRKP